MPITWEGWVAVALFLVALFGEIAFTSGWVRTIALTVVVCAFIAVCALKTQGGMRWRWGDDD